MSSISAQSWKAVWRQLKSSCQCRRHFTLPVLNAELLRNSNYKVTTKNIETQGTIVLPGSPSCDDFDRAGNWSIADVHRKLNPHRLLKVLGISKYKDSLREHCDVVMLSSKMEVMPRFWMLWRKTVFPSLAVSFELCDVGTSGFSDLYKLYDTSTKQVYAINTNNHMTTDIRSRDAKPLPDWWREQYSSHSTSDSQQPRPLLIPPAKVGHTYKLTALWEHVNDEHHISSSAQLLYCMDAAVDAVFKNQLKEFNHDLLNYQVKHVDMVFKKECRGGDGLEIFVWQHSTNPYLLHCVVYKDNHVLSQVNIEFYTPIFKDDQLL